MDTSRMTPRYNIHELFPRDNYNNDNNNILTEKTRRFRIRDLDLSFRSTPYSVIVKERKMDLIIGLPLI